MTASASWHPTDRQPPDRPIHSITVCDLQPIQEPTTGRLSLPSASTARPTLHYRSTLAQGARSNAQAQSAPLIRLQPATEGSEQHRRAWKLPLFHSRHCILKSSTPEVFSPTHQYHTTSPWDLRLYTRTPLRQHYHVTPPTYRTRHLPACSPPDRLPNTPSSTYLPDHHPAPQPHRTAPHHLAVTATATATARPPFSLTTVYDGIA